MGKQAKGNRNTRGMPVDHIDDMDDEIDAFHKQRDVVPLDINAEVGESDDEQPVFDFEDINDDANGEDEDDDDQDTGFAAKIVRQGKYMRAKFGGVEDDLHDDEEDEEENKVVWGGQKSRYYDGDNRDFELQSSDDESPAEEEAEVLRLQKEKAKSLSMADMGLEDVSEVETDRELTLEELSDERKGKVQFPLIKAAGDEMGTVYEQVKKDLNALSKEEQMDVVYSSAPELVGLLSELNDAIEQLESKVNPLLEKVKEGEIMREGGMRYLEVKQILLLAYCQAITFYLLLKSEGQPVRDHPVIARLVEIKGLLEKIKQLDGHLPFEFEKILMNNYGAGTVVKAAKEGSPHASVSVSEDHGLPHILADTQQGAKPLDTTELAKVKLSRDQETKRGKRKHQGDHFGVESMEMLKVRAALEEKLKQKGVFGSLASKPEKARKHQKLINGYLETHDDFDDEAIDVERKTYGLRNGHASSLPASRLSQLVTLKVNKPKVISGDDDLPKRDDVGERRRKYELKVLAGAGVKSEDDAGDELQPIDANVNSDAEEVDSGGSDGETGGSEDEFYKQAQLKRAAKIAAKAEKYSRTSSVPSLPETVDGKRQITYQIEKNRGLTRPRNKLTKNPRKKYRTKHVGAVKRRKGQVRDVKKPYGPYGGEASGINAGISRSIRFKN
ncbi:something about silencing protein 10-like isoform X1 [Tripterygium wilfordii]|uniref:Something about silencing protein 10-like isoform X1 n=1 Tax=Tripterygium wilfordii TaxID=458696 RepID=A0A7J7C3T6_TRIWF|nr:something about silencing protein 10 [Tripterygium wilfordii]XP_038691991.1 something about silencing protein 10 [Tripterygium wilfordii]XP_038691993.1 something about silencing protein 10 [Tripterygium wilfordii]KAF5728782.1 something about silencing protein 10-like isoform X1 [Tripterygium wilfordii]